MDNQALEILKWVGIVLAAGFVGYFGRYLAMMIIERWHKKESPPLPTSESPPTEEAPQSQDVELEQSKLKLEKKKAKAEAKKTKKEGRG